MLQRCVQVRGHLDVRLVFVPLGGGGRDPCLVIGRSAVEGVWRATRTRDGPVTMHLVNEGPSRVRASAWGQGAGAALEGASTLLSADNEPEPLAGRHPLVDELSRRHPGLRFARTGAVFEALAPTVLAQKVQGAQAARAWRAMVRAISEPAPGPAPLFLPPDPARLAATPSWAFHRWGVEHRRAETLRVAAGYAGRLAGLAGVPLAEAKQRLAALPGVGVWTVNEVSRAALGDVDAVSVGDYWLKHHVAWALAGEARGTDEQMLDLLEPWRGQRGLVCRLLELGGPKLPRFGPRLPLRSIAAT